MTTSLPPPGPGPDPRHPRSRRATRAMASHVCPAGALASQASLVTGRRAERPSRCHIVAVLTATVSHRGGTSADTQQIAGALAKLPDVVKVTPVTTRNGDARRAVQRGTGLSARVVTAAAMIMFSIFVAFMFTNDPRWFARHIPDPDIEGQRLDRELAGARGTVMSEGTRAGTGYPRSRSRAGSTRP